MRLAVVLVAGVLAMVGCGSGGPDRDETRERLIDDIGLSDVQATCVVDALFALPDDDIRDELTENTPDLSDEQQVQVEQLLAACDVA